MEINTKTKFNIGDEVFYKVLSHPVQPCVICGVIIHYCGPHYEDKPCIFYDILWGNMPNQRINHVYAYYIFERKDIKKNKCKNCPLNREK